MKQIVILGGGFAGVAAALQLVKRNLRDTTITLIDRNSFHLFTPSLYEVATSEEPKRNIAIPFSEIFGKKIRTIQNSIEEIDTGQQTVILKNQDAIHYDYLIIALGSEPAYFNIPGLKEHAIALKTVKDAIEIKNSIKSLCCKEGKCNRKVNVVIGGGGFSGTELSAELLMYKDRLAKQHHLATDCLQVSIIQGSDKLLKELDTHVSDLAQKRVAGPQTTFCFGGHITNVTDKEILTDSGKTYPYNIFIWTGGVTANHIAANSKLPVTKHGQILVNEFLQMQGVNNVFVAGDIAEFVDPKTQKPVPGVAQVAEDQGVVAGENVYHAITGKPFKQYHYRHFGYIVPLKGRFAAAELMGNVHIDGLLGWVLQQLTFFYYLLHILPIFKAFNKWNTFELELSQ